MDLHDPYRAPDSSRQPSRPGGAVDMSAIAFSEDEKVATAATIAAGYSSGGIVAWRWLASIVDSLALMFILLAPVAVLGREVFEQTFWLWLALAAAYFPVMEVLLGGALGKLATGTRVVNIHGQRPSWGQAITRTLLRLVEANPMLVGGIPAGIAVLASGQNQRIGDMLAKTYVLHRRDIARIRAPGAARIEPGMPKAGD